MVSWVKGAPYWKSQASRLKQSLQRRVQPDTKTLTRTPGPLAMSQFFDGCVIHEHAPLFDSLIWIWVPLQDTAVLTPAVGFTWFSVHPHRGMALAGRFRFRKRSNICRYRPGPPDSSGRDQLPGTSSNSFSQSAAS